MTTTTTKKELVDFLWDWANTHDDWGKLLVDKVVRTESRLSKSERQEVFDYFLQSVGLKYGLPTLAIAKPAYAPSAKQVELISLSEVKGVNKLASNQTLEFKEHLTVIYGENGTGKTGYGRILKALGISYDPHRKIFSNIFATAEPQSATVKYKANGTDATFTWDGANSNADLKTLSVFNNNCVQISLSESRGLIVSPIGFHLFNIISTELNELEDMLNTTIQKYPTQLPWNALLNLGTPQSIFLNALSHTSTEAQLSVVSDFTANDQVQLTSLEHELKNLNKTLLDTEIKMYSSQIADLDNVEKKIGAIKNIFNAENWKKLIELNERIAILEKSKQLGLKDIVAGKGVELYESKEFQLFLRSAEEYIKLLGRDYPEGDSEVCVYCRQPLETGAKKLLGDYRKLLTDTTQETLKRLTAERKILVTQAVHADISIQLHHASFGSTDKAEVIQPTELIDFCSIVKSHQQKIKDGLSASELFTCEYETVTKLLSAKQDELRKIHQQKSADLGNLAMKEKVLDVKIKELKDKKLMSEKKIEVTTAITNHNIVAKLENSRAKFNTAGLSRKTTEARDELIKQNFTDTFHSELKLLRKSQITVELNFGTSRGQSQVYQKLRTHALSDILSEGEQKAIALAEFLTELQLDNSATPVVFDDPVNSLDHKIIDDFARRLITLSGTRQTIVFTHSILLFNSLIQQSQLDINKKWLAAKFYNLQNYRDVSGIVEDAMELNSYKYYEKGINTLLNNAPTGVAEKDLAASGYGLLRSAIEITVEQDILKDTVKRYRRNVALTSFLKVKGTVLDVHKIKLNEIFERCSGYIEGHSNPTEMHNDPTLQDLKTDFNDFKVIRDAFLN